MRAMQIKFAFASAWCDRPYWMTQQSEFHLSDLKGSFGSFCRCGEQPASTCFSSRQLERHRRSTTTNKFPYLQTYLSNSTKYHHKRLFFIQSYLANKIGSRTASHIDCDLLALPALSGGTACPANSSTLRAPIFSIFLGHFYD